MKASIFGSGIGATRLERLTIKMALKADEVHRHQSAIDTVLAGRPPNLGEDDIMNLDYTMVAEYIGDVERKLRAIRSILKDRDVVARVSIDELQHGESLFVSIIDHIRAISQR